MDFVDFQKDYEDGLKADFRDHWPKKNARREIRLSMALGYFVGRGVMNHEKAMKLAIEIIEEEK
jgi:hypothetical protein